MKKNNSNLDERQINIRNKYGYQSFAVLSTLSLIILFFHNKISPFVDTNILFLTAILTSLVYCEIRCIVKNIYEKNALRTQAFSYGILAILKASDVFLDHKVTIFNIWFFVSLLTFLAISIFGLIKCEKQEKETE